LSWGHASTLIAPARSIIRLRKCTLAGFSRPCLCQPSDQKSIKQFSSVQSASKKRRQRAQRASSDFNGKQGALDAANAAMAMVNQMVQSQATILTYIDVFVALSRYQPFVFAS
jgi:hypothetical protein